MANKENVKEEKFEKIIDEKEKFNVVKLIGNIIFWGVFSVFVVLAIVAFLNYTKVESGDEPYFAFSEKEYNEDGTDVTVYDYYIYKVVEAQSSENKSVSLKLWFLDDINKD